MKSPSKARPCRCKSLSRNRVDTEVNGAVWTAPGILLITGVSAIEKSLHKDPFMSLLHAFNGHKEARASIHGHFQSQDEENAFYMDNVLHAVPCPQEEARRP